MRFILYAGHALDYCKVIDDFVAKTNDLQRFKLTPKDWSAIQLVCCWLKAFCAATTQILTMKRSMLSSTQAIFCRLYESLLTRLSPHIAKQCTFSSQGFPHQKLSDYYAKFDDSPYNI
jgi:hypothetical protein